MSDSPKLPTTEVEAKKRLADIFNSEEHCGFVEIETQLFERICDLLKVFDAEEEGDPRP